MGVFAGSWRATSPPGQTKDMEQLTDMLTRQTPPAWPDHVRRWLAARVAEAYTVAPYRWPEPMELLHTLVDRPDCPPLLRELWDGGRQELGRLARAWGCSPASVGWLTSALPPDLAIEAIMVEALRRGDTPWDLRIAISWHGGAWPLVAEAIVAIEMSVISAALERG